MNKEHRKHEKLARPSLGDWGRTELALLGAPCSSIRALAERIMEGLGPSWRMAFADAEHPSGEDTATGSAARLMYTEKVGGAFIDLRDSPAGPQRRGLFAGCDAVLVNGNHFNAAQQVVIVDPAKPLQSKLDRLRDVRLFLLRDRETRIPDYLQALIGDAPVLMLEDTAGIVSVISDFLQKRLAPLNGLLLAGGKSLRMGRDKSLLDYHGLPQRDYVLGMLKPVCQEVYLSCGAGHGNEASWPCIEDRFLGIGPIGGILSAMQRNPDAAWLTLACDLPFLSRSSLDFLVAQRDPSRLATSFKGPDKELPEPLITIWEPRAYPVLLQALSEGQSCPRKVLIASDVKLLEAPDPAELQNVNDPGAFIEARSRLNIFHTNDPL